MKSWALFKLELDSLLPEFGLESAVSMFMAGQRKLNLKQVRKLSARFHLLADVFISKEPH